MNQQRKIREAVQKMSGTWMKDYASFIDCEVVSVDMDNRLCDCKAIGGDSDFDVPSVQLMPEPNDGQLIIPKIGSAVRVGITQRNEPFVVMFSEIDTVYMVSETLYQFNDGTFGGLVKVKNTLNPSEGLLKKLNNLENKLNDLVAKFNTHIHPAIDSVTAAPVTVSVTVSVTDPTIPTPIVPTTESEISNSMITHGI